MSNAKHYFEDVNTVLKLLCVSRPFSDWRCFTQMLLSSCCWNWSQEGSLLQKGPPAPILKTDCSRLNRYHHQCVTVPKMLNNTFSGTKYFRYNSQFSILKTNCSRLNGYYHCTALNKILSLARLRLSFRLAIFWTMFTIFLQFLQFLTILTVLDNF